MPAHLQTFESYFDVETSINLAIIGDYDQISSLALSGLEKAQIWTHLSADDYYNHYFNMFDDYENLQVSNIRYYTESYSPIGWHFVNGVTTIWVQS